MHSAPIDTYLIILIINAIEMNAWEPDVSFAIKNRLIHIIYNVNY